MLSSTYCLHTVTNSQDGVCGGALVRKWPISGSRPGPDALASARHLEWFSGIKAVSSTRVSEMDTLLLPRVRFAHVPWRAAPFRSKVLPASLLWVDGGVSVGMARSVSVAVPFRFASPPRPAPISTAVEISYRCLGPDLWPMVPLDHANVCHDLNPAQRAFMRSSLDEVPLHTIDNICEVCLAAITANCASFPRSEEERLRRSVKG
jgi:hypothetical protein